MCSDQVNISNSFLYFDECFDELKFFMKTEVLAFKMLQQVFLLLFTCLAASEGVGLSACLSAAVVCEVVCHC